MSRSLARSLEELAGRDGVAATFGGKAAGLARLVSAGARVPPGFALSRAAYDDAVAAAGITESLREAGDDALARAVETMAHAAVPPALAREIERRTRGLGDRLIVRSSATIEDAAGAAAPGIFSSIAGVAPADVAAAVARVWASALAPAARAYLAARGRDPAELGMGAIVQREIPADCRGVAYSRGAAAGGEIDLEIATGDDITWAVLPRGGGEPELGPGCPLARAEIQRVAAAATAAEAAIAAGATGADVEWVIAAGEVWVVQARPVTPGPGARAVEPPRWVYSELTRRDPDATWRWDASHNPEPLSLAQIGLVERVDATGDIPERLALAGHNLYTAPSRDHPEPPPPDEPIDAYFRDRIAPAAEAALAPAEDPATDLSSCLSAYDAICRIYFAELTPAVSAARRALPALLRELGFDDAEGLAAELVAGAAGAASNPGRIGREALAPLAPAWDVAAPTYGEMPDWLDRRLAELQAAGVGRDVAALRTDAAERFAEIRDPLGAEDARRLERSLAAARAAAEIAEVDDRLFFRAQAAMRRALLALARAWKLVDPADVFWLPLDEVVQLDEHGGAPDPSDAHRRAERARREADAQRAWAMPLAVAGGRPVAPPRRGGSGYWSGRGTGGRARGAALHLGGSHALPPSSEGRVVVAAAITPASVLAVRGAAAIVAEHGGALGHAAALARELGIPCVAGCLGIFRGVADGDALLVDADAGIVVELP